MSTENPDNGADQQPEPGFSFSDKRRIDPETGEVRSPGASAQDSEPAAGADAPGAENPNAEAPAGDASTSPEEGAPPAGEGAEPVADASDLGVEIPDDASELDEAGADAPAEPASEEAKRYLDDLQRLNAEYAAYRRRAQRDQERAKQIGVEKVAEALIPVLDEIKLAEENGDVSGPFETHVKKLRDTLAKVGIEQFGAAGEVFNPDVHEALMQQPNEEVAEPTVFMVMQPGYRVGERTIRAARVGVHMPLD